MKKTYQIEVDCANCANLMEQATLSKRFLRVFLIWMFTTFPPA